jgi:hypothetical protein
MVERSRRAWAAERAQTFLFAFVDDSRCGGLRAGFSRRLDAGRVWLPEQDLGVGRDHQQLAE